MNLAPRNTIPMVLEVSAPLSSLHNCPPVFRRCADISATETRNMMTGIPFRLPLFSRIVIVTEVESGRVPNQCSLLAESLINRSGNKILTSVALSAVSTRYVLTVAEGLCCLYKGETSMYKADTVLPEMSTARGGLSLPASAASRAAAIAAGGPSRPRRRPGGIPFPGRHGSRWYLTGSFGPCVLAAGFRRRQR